VVKRFASFALALAVAVLASKVGGAQEPPSPAGVPRPGPVTDGPYVPQPILPGGIVVPLYAPGSPDLKADRVREAETYNMASGVPGRIQSIVNIHNPSIEAHFADPAINTGAAVIVVPGGGHRTLNVGSEGADVVSYLYNYGVNAIILRNRLRNDGYVAEVDAVKDALQALRITRARAAEWKIDPQKVGIMGFSAGAELASATAIAFADFDEKHAGPDKVSARPSFVVLVYPGPTPFAKGATPKIPRNVPPTFIAVRAPATASTRSGRTNTSPRCSSWARPTSRCTSTATGARRRPQAPRRDSVRHLAGPVRRLVPRPRVPRQARRRDERPSAT
jgi:endo-1,4-beta-xylanase